MKKYLGDGAPPDLHFVSDDLYKQLLDGASAIQDSVLRLQEIDRVNTELRDSRGADLRWAAWWSNLHSDLLYSKDPLTMILYAIEANMQAASVVLLVSMPATPVLYRWWIVAPCLYWVVLRVLQAWRVWKDALDPWASFSQQIAYLRQLLPGGQERDARTSITGPRTAA